MLDIMRRILAFVEARKGLVETDGERILFSSDADVELYKALVDELDREMAKSDQIRSEAIGRVSTTAQGKF